MGCSNVGTARGGGRGFHRRVDGVGRGWQQLGGGQQRCGGDRGSTMGCLQPLRTALHTISISLQNNLSWNRAETIKEHLIPAGRYLFIPFLRTNSQKLQTKNRQTKNRIKKIDRTNIIATNFVWEQLIITAEVLCGCLFPVRIRLGFLPRFFS